MPELPEIETTCSALKPLIVGKTIKKVTVRCTKLRYPLGAIFSRCVHRQKITAISRRSKYLLIHFKKGGGLLWHFGMSGSLRLETIGTHPRKHDHIIINFDKYSLHYHDPRRFGFVLLVHDFKDCELLQTLGPEPLTKAFSATYLYQRLSSKHISIKQAIMDNHIVVGVGNIYANESLFNAKIHPQKKSCELDFQHCQRLVISIKKILKRAINKGGTTLRDFVSPSGGLGYFKFKLNVYDRQNLACKICSNAIKKVVIAKRSTYYCDKCQI